jgi:hypothetical protein
MANDETTRKEETENPELDDQVLEDVSGGEDLDTNNNNNNN